MPSHPPNEFDNEEDPCETCTLDDCVLCPTNQSEFDRHLDINSLHDSLNNYFEAEKEEPLPQEPPSPAKPVQPPPPKIIDVIPEEIETAPVKETPSPVKKKPGAPKGNVNAVKHGLYLNGTHVSNTTPMERAKLSDLNQLIEHVKIYIEKVYENGLTLKTTEEMNDTLKKISSASIALTRLLHTHDALMNSGIPYKMNGDTRAGAIKVLNFYHDKVDLYSELTTPASELGQEQSGCGK